MKMTDVKELIVTFIAPRFSCHRLYHSIYLIEKIYLIENQAK